MPKGYGMSAVPESLSKALGQEGLGLKIPGIGVWEAGNTTTDVSREKAELSKPLLFSSKDTL